MARIRTIQPDFPRSPSMGRISREARLLFVLLWTIVDDEGRCHAAPDDLAQVLYPADFDAHMYLLDWLDQLENENCIERYEVDDVDYLRIVRWKRHQRIYHPTPSYLPPPPSEEVDDSEIREISGKLNGRGRKVRRDPIRFPKIAIFARTVLPKKTRRRWSSRNSACCATSKTSAPVPWRRAST